MKILLDECVTKKLKYYLSQHEVLTVTEMKWSGLKNGKLLTECVNNNFDLLLTIDKNILFQQNISNYNLILVVFDSESSKIEELIQFVLLFNLRVQEFQKKNWYIIKKEQ